MARKSKGKNGKKSTKVEVDFSGVEGRSKVKDGNYKVKVVKVIKKQGEGDHPYLNWELETVGKKKKEGGAKLWLTTSLAPQALWNLKNLLEVLGVEVPDDTVELELGEFEGLEFMVEVGERTGNDGKKRKGSVLDFYPLDEAGDEDDDEDVEVADDDEDSEDDEDEESSDDDEDEDEDDEDDKPKKGKKSKKDKKSKKSKKDDDDEDDEDEEESDDDEDEDSDDDSDDDEDEEDGDKLTADAVNDMKAKELKKVIKDNELDVDLEDYSSIGKKRKAVIEALEEADLLDE